MEGGRYEPELTTEHIEALIHTLYRPNPPDVIAATQKRLTEIQSSSHSWAIARDLLTRPDEKVRFHGALIIIVKLNTESSTLGDHNASELLTSLLDWYMASVAHGGSVLVSRKLSSALATYLIHFPHLWRRFVPHLVQCMATGQLVDPEVPLSGFPEHLECLDPVRSRAILWVISNVVDDAAKVDFHSAHNSELYETLRLNVAESTAVIWKSLEYVQPDPKADEEAIRCLQSWVWFSQKLAARDSLFIDSLRPLIAAVIAGLSTNDVFQSAVELLTDILSNFPSLLTSEHYTLLADTLEKAWCVNYYQRLQQGDFEFDAVQFGQLMLAYGEARVEILMRSESHQDQALLGKLCGLLSLNGHPVVEDRIFVPAVEFWSTYVETLTDEVFSNAEGAIPWASTATSFVLEAVSNAWQRIIYPDASELSQWDNSDRIGFIDARKDVADLLQSTYALTGSRLLVTFADLLISAASAEDWARLEAAAFCLGSLADCAKEELQSDEALSSVFSSPLFNTLRGGHALLPPRVRQTCVGLIEKYTEFFERHTELLPPALNLLFSLVGDTTLSQPISRSILRLCSSCRHHLHSETGAFLDEYQRMNASQTMECEVAEKVLGGIASVAQALEVESERLQALRKIVGFVEIDLQTCQTLIASSNATGRLTCPPESRCLDESGDESPALHMGIRVLRCLSSVAKAFQIPAERPVEIDGHSRLELEMSPQLADLQRHIFDIIVQLQRAFPQSVEVVDNICSILRSGFSETEHGPFVFPPRQIAEYLFSHTTHSPRIGALVKTACSFTSSLKQYGEGSMRDNLLADLFTWAIGLLRGLSGPETDPELSHNAIDFITRVLSEAPQVLLDAQPFDPSEFFFLFTLQALDGKEPLPKMASAGFWAHFLQLAGNLPPVQHRVIELMKTLGPLVSGSLMRNFGGNASRSELDKLSEPLKKLITWYPAAPGWLESALEQVSFPGSQLNPREKTIFVKKLVSLRGSRTTTQVARDFWLAARGSSFAYAS